MDMTPRAGQDVVIVVRDRHWPIGEYFTKPDLFWK